MSVLIDLTEKFDKEEYTLLYDFALPGVSAVEFEDLYYLTSTNEMGGVYGEPISKETFIMLSTLLSFEEKVKECYVSSAQSKIDRIAIMYGLPAGSTMEEIQEFVNPKD